jgi:hypothetical protein
MIAMTNRVDISLNYVNQRDVGGRPGRIEGAFVDIAVRL